MKLWLLTYIDNDSGSGTVQFWATSQRAARARAAELKRDPPANFAVFGIAPVKVPARRKELVEFLNRYANAA